ncbi:MAG: TVP38/TMEM64 family protein [Holdemania massiliensis]
MVEALPKDSTLGLILACGILLIPALPLVAIVTINISAHGAILGFFYSWIGTTVGSLIVFLFFRRIVKHRLMPWFSRSASIQKALNWVAGRNAAVLFILVAMPFTPSSFINIAFGLSDFEESKFIKTLIAAKLIMMFGLSVFGKTLSISFTRPIYLLLAAGILAVLYCVSVHFRKKHGL